MVKKPDRRRASTEVRLELRRQMQLLRARGKTHVEIAEITGYTRTYVSTMLKRLAREPALLAGLRRRLGRANASLPLFDSARFTRHLEAAYVEMVRRHAAGQAPAAFEVAADGASESLILTPDGNAFEVTYAVNVQQPGLLIYASRFLHAGTYDAGRYRIVQRVEGFRSLAMTGTGAAGGAVRHERVGQLREEDRFLRRFGAELLRVRDVVLGEAQDLARPRHGHQELLRCLHARAARDARRELAGRQRPLLEQCLHVDRTEVEPRRPGRIDRAEARRAVADEAEPRRRRRQPARRSVLTRVAQRHSSSAVIA